MGDLHLTFDLLRAFAQGDVPADSLVRIGLGHLTACPVCQAGLRAWQKERDLGPPALRLLSHRLLEPAGTAGARQRYEIGRDARELLRLSQPDRLLRVERSIHRFRGGALAALLLWESRERRAADPGEAQALAEVAQAILLRTPTGPGVAAISVLAAAYLGSALRAGGQIEEAVPRFELARALIRNEKVADPLVLAEVDACAAELARDLRREEEAAALHARSIFLYTLAGDRNRGILAG